MGPLCAGSPIGKRHYRITFADALEAHRTALEFGGLDGIPNPSLVQAAIARPYSGYYLKVELKAAALVQSLSTNHGFADGNKRTTLILLDLFLTKSDYQLVPLPGEDINEAVEQMILSTVQRAFSKEDLVRWFKRRLRRL